MIPQRKIVFDIQKFALNDGPGIRTTVFLKGCPLRCVWCCNPESQNGKLQLGFNEEKCTNCLKCLTVCKNGTLSSGLKVIQVNQSSCDACGECVSICPEDAFKIYGLDCNAREVIEEVMKDKPYFDESEGGVTFSGGEVLFQIDFLLELLTESKRNGLHTCIETSVYAKQEDLEKVIPLVDLFIVDYKLTDTTMHKKYTGVENELILSNIKFLYEKDCRMIIRCPIVPGINDVDNHFQGIATLSTLLPKISCIELMPYHHFGFHKYKFLGKLPIEMENVKNNQAQIWLERIKSFGGINIFIHK